MKTFRFPLGHEEGKTMTVGELKGILSMYPDKMPVPTGFAEIVSDNLPVLHTVDSVLFCDLHSNDKSDTKSARAKIIAE